VPRQEVVEQFVSTVVGGDYVGAIERFYAPRASMQENQRAARIGREDLVRHERRVMRMFHSIVCEIVGRPLIAADHVAIRWRFAFTPPGGNPFTLEEVAWQRWQGDRIQEETFYYDPKQLPSPATYVLSAAWRAMFRLRPRSPQAHKNERAR
jgi:hypothetical protein